MSGVLTGIRRLDRFRKFAWSRHFSAPAALTLAGSVVQNFEESKVRSRSAATVAGSVTASASLQFIANLSLTHFASTFKPQAPNEGREIVKKEIRKLMATGRYENLLLALVNWTAPGASIAWTEIISHAELSHILGQIVHYQIGLITKAGTARLIDTNAVSTKTKLTQSHEIREQLRMVYSNLLFDQETKTHHVYETSRRSALGATGLDLSSQDYENLITLELNNAKLDLASKWFQRLEQQYPDGAHYRHMTYRLWLLKFEVYGGASPALWKVDPSELYEKLINPRKSQLKSERLWLDVFNDFIKHQQVMLGNTQLVFDKHFTTVMLFSVAYSRNVGQLSKLIELNWGITPQGKMLSKFKKLAKDDPLFPDIDVLKAVVTSLLFNRQFVPSMAYMNAFQEHYGIELSKSKHFWDQIFRWSEVTTRFSEYRALQHFIRETATTLKSSGDSLSITLEEAQKSPDFDYEGYLKFVGDLRNQRSKLILELWKCYGECQPGYSPRVFRTYLSLLVEEPTEEKCYEFLTILALQKQLHSISPDSFNRTLPKELLCTVNQLYTKCMKTLVELKGTNGNLGQIGPIISRWSLDDSMRNYLDNWSHAQQERYLEIANEKRNSAKEEEEDEDEEFLGLMS